ncbi:MAG: muropeptide transporter AmpG [Thermodesulfatator sp.]|nr:MAG: muropeptide transporter AmpG [Thermodesulfatator sp.]
MFPMGFASGLPLALSGGTLQAWLTVAGVDIKTIGLFSMVGIPYTLKFVWSPVMDRFNIPLLGRRRGWILLCQVFIILITAAMAMLNPSSQAAAMGLAAILLAFFSASQDVVIDAYRTDSLKERERGLGVGLTVTGYRIAMLVSGALALILADHIGWHATYIAMAAVMAGSALFTLIAPEPGIPGNPPGNIREAVIEPLKEILSREAIILFLFLIILYKIGDAFAGTLTTAFLIRGAGFSPTDVGTINKGLGLAATIIGAMAGGGLMIRMGLYGSLMLFGILQAVSNLAFMALALVGKSYPMMIGAVGLENICGGMGTAAFVAFLMALCNRRFSATQYAILSALAAVGRVFVGPPSGILVDMLGWPEFFFFTFLAALPGLFMLRYLKKHINVLDA